MDCSPPDSVHGIFQARILGCLPFPPPGHLPDPGIEPASPVPPALAAGFFTTEPPRNLHNLCSEMHSKERKWVTGGFYPQLWAPRLLQSHPNYYLFDPINNLYMAFQLVAKYFLKWSSLDSENTTFPMDTCHLISTTFPWYKKTCKNRTGSQRANS